MERHATRLSPTLVVGVGAAFDFHAGTKSRAPEWSRRSGFEWAHRLAHEPRRLIGRYVRTNSASCSALGACLTKRHLMT